MMIEPGRDFAQVRAEHEKIDYQVVLVQRAGDFDRHVIIMTVEPLAVAGERDEMRRAEHVFGLGDANLVIVTHGELLACYHTDQFSRPSRRSTNSAAAIRSAVVPGLRRWA